MNTTTTQLATYRQIESEIKAVLAQAIADNLLANGSVFLSNEDGGPISDAEALASHATLSVDVVFFREGSRPLTTEGRADVHAERVAADAVFRLLDGHGGEVSDYDGDSIDGPLYGRTLDLLAAAN